MKLIINKIFNYIKKIVFSINIISTIFLISSFIGGYYLIQETLINLHVTSGMGFIQNYAALNSLKSSKNKYRFISSGHMTTVPLFYDLDTFDGYITCCPFRRNYFIGYGIYDPPVNKLHMHTHFFYDFPKNIDINMFKMANVRYVISSESINNSNMKLIYYSKGIYAEDIQYLFKAILNTFFKHLRLVNPIYLYELEDVWPRIFVAKKLRISTYSFLEEEFYEQLKTLSKGEILISKEDIPNKSYTTNAHMKVLDYELNQNGGTINIVGNETKGGIIVFNQVSTPQWKASCYNEKLEIIPANAIMMAMIVPKNCKQIDLEYNLSKNQLNKKGALNGK